MSKFTSWAVGTAAMWLSTGTSIITALYFTQRISVLWFFLIPALCGYSVKENVKRNNKDI